MLLIAPAGNRPIFSRFGSTRLRCAAGSHIRRMRLKFKNEAGYGFSVQTFSCTSEIASTKCRSLSATAFRSCARCSRMVECVRGRRGLRSDLPPKKSPEAYQRHTRRGASNADKPLAADLGRNGEGHPPNRGRGRRTPLARLVSRSSGSRRQASKTLASSIVHFPRRRISAPTG
jgi:hypothetical protein